MSSRSPGVNGEGRILGKGSKQRHRCELRASRLPVYPLTTRYVPDLLELRARIANHLGNRAEAMKIGLYLLHVGLARVRCDIDQKTYLWERHFDFLEQLRAATVEGRLGVNRHGFELDAVFLRAFVA